MGKKVVESQSHTGCLEFVCPGCKDTHVVRISGEGKARWGYNNNPESPTFTPSLLVRSGHHTWKDGKDPATCFFCHPPDGEPSFSDLCYVCHSFITDGRIQFLGDCTHELAGQTVSLEDLDAE